MEIEIELMKKLRETYEKAYEKGYMILIYPVSYTNAFGIIGIAKEVIPFESLNGYILTPSDLDRVYIDPREVQKLISILKNIQ